MFICHLLLNFNFTEKKKQFKNFLDLSKESLFIMTVYIFMNSPLGLHLDSKYNFTCSQHRKMNCRRIHIWSQDNNSTWQQLQPDLLWRDKSHLHQHNDQHLIQSSGSVEEESAIYEIYNQLDKDMFFYWSSLATDIHVWRWNHIP